MAYLIGNQNPRAGLHGEIGVGNIFDDIIKKGQDAAKTVAETAGAVQKTATSLIPGMSEPKKKSGGGAGLSPAQLAQFRMTSRPAPAPSFGVSSTPPGGGDDNTKLYVGGALAVGAAFLLLRKK